MYIGLLHVHSFLRWIILALLIITVIRAFSGWIAKKPFSSLDDKFSLFSLIAVHIQLIVGIVLYFISDLVRAGFGNFGAAMKDSNLRFWLVEHNLGMLIAITLVTIGRISIKKAGTDILKHKKIALYFLFALLIILISIPWPFSAVSRPWF